MFRVSVCLALTAAAPLFGQAGSAAQEHADKAVQFAQGGDLRGAESELKKAIELSPDDPALLTSLGGILAMEGDLRRANPYLAKAVKLNPNDAAARRNLAANQWQLGELKEAHQNLERLLAGNPRDPVATYLMGMVAEREGNYDRSITLLESMPDITTRQPEALVALASSYYHTTRSQQAAASLNQLSGRSVKPEVLFMAGRVAMDGGDYALAESLLSAIPPNYAKRAEVEARIASAQYSQGHKAASEKTLMEAIRTGKGSEEAYLLLCKILTEQSASDRALRVASEAAKAYPGSYQLLLTKGTIETKLNYFTAAVESFQKADRLHASAETGRDLAEAEWLAGEKKKAIDYFENTMRRFPQDSKTCQRYGTLLLEDGSPENKARAIELLKQALAKDNSSVDARYQLANAELENGRLQPALDYLSAAIKLDPDASRLHFALSRVYRRLGREADANSEMELYQKLKAAELSHP